MRVVVITSVLLLGLINCSISSESFKSEIDGVYIPKNLNEAISQLDKELNDSIKSNIIVLTEGEFVANSHFGLGLWIRNNWGLWKNSRLSRYFKLKGITRPDDMSVIILTSYYRELKGIEIDLREQVKPYKAYSKEAKKRWKLVELPPDSKQPEVDLEFDYKKWYRNNETGKRSLIHIQTNSETDSLWIYDYLFGWEKVSQSMGKELKYTGNSDSLMHVIFKKE